jgi:hypothetical protein
MTIDLSNVPTQAARGVCGVELSLDHDVSPDDVQTTGKPNQR